MTWLKLDENIMDHPKIETLSKASFYAYITSLCYCSKYLTDGKLSPKIVATSTRPLQRNALVSAGLWDLVDGTYYVHNYTVHQRTREEVLASRDKDARRKREKRAGALSTPESTPDTSPVSTMDSTPESERRVEESRGEEKKTTPSLASEDESFKEFYDEAYPRKKERGRARKAWRTAVKKATPERIIAAAWAVRKSTEGKDLQFIPYPASWLNGECWLDEPDAPPAGPTIRPYDPDEL
jgi:hypothetical protein